jgi:hypothetical protein
VDRINQELQAGNDDQAFYLAFQYFRARAASCHKRRPGDADGFRRQGAHLLAGLAGEIHSSHPRAEFQTLIPGGEWTP